MELYYQIMCLLLDLKAKEMRKIKVLKYDIKHYRSKQLNRKELIVELKYQKCSINLLNRIIRSVNRIVGKVDLDNVYKEANQEEEFEEI